MPRNRLVVFVATLSLLLGLAAPVAAQHGPLTDHLLGNGAFGNLELVSKLRVHDAEPDVVADLTVFKNYIYVSKWGASDCAGPETGGQKTPDGGAYVIDISDIAHPREVGFIATSQDTLVGEGMQALTLTTSAFSGDVLVMNHEGCGKNFKAGFSLWNITNPLKPVKLSEHFGDFTTDGLRNTPHRANEYHSAFAWDAGYILADVTNPARPVFLGDSDYAAVDPELLAQTGVALTPEGNGHEAEFTLDNKFAITTDEDFSPYRLQITTVDGNFRAALGSQTTKEQVEGISNFTTVFVGRACPGDAAVPPAPNVGPGQVAVVERGLCLFEEKAQNVIAAGGWEAMLIFNREGADACTTLFSPSLSAPIPTLFVTRPTGFAMFNITYDDAACRDANFQRAPIAIGTFGDPIQSVSSQFDGWGYVHLFGVDLRATSASLTDLDTFAIPEAMDPAYAKGFGALSVHEVATDKTDATRAYLSYYAGGIRALQVHCEKPRDRGMCRLVETRRGPPRLLDHIMWVTE